MKELKGYHPNTDLPPNMGLLWCIRNWGEQYKEMSALGHLAPAKGERGLRRATKKNRHRRNMAKARRVTLCSFAESEK